jgi:hypothetical protein
MQNINYNMFFMLNMQGLMIGPHPRAGYTLESYLAQPTQQVESGKEPGSIKKQLREGASRLKSSPKKNLDRSENNLEKAHQG